MTGAGRDLKVAGGLGRILHDRGVDAMDGATDVAACAGKSEADCFLLKRSGGPVDATLNAKDAVCDNACVLILAGGIRRTLHATTRVILTGTEIHNRLGLNVSDEHRTGLTVFFNDQSRVYLREMGIDTEVLDIVERNSAAQRATEVPRADWMRLHLVTSAPQ
jgi:hypothetical protein